MKKNFLWKAGWIAAFVSTVTVLPFSNVPGTMAVRAEDETPAETEPGTEESEDVVAVSFTTDGETADSGTYPAEFPLELSTTEGYTIYYTTDGSNPLESKTRQTYQGEEILVTDRSEDENVLAAVDPSEFDSANVRWDSKNNKFVSKLTPPEKEAVDKATVIKAVAVDDTDPKNYTEVVTNTYFIGAMAEHIQGIQESCEASGMDLSVMSISMDYNDLFDPEKGIYVHGDAFDDALRQYLDDVGAEGNDPITDKNAVDVARGLNANYKQKGRDWERNAHVDYFESNGTETTCYVQQDCGIRVQGNFSRSDYQKSFRLYARSEYGKKNFKHKFFGDSAINAKGEPMKKFKRLTLRSGGNAAFNAKYNDAYWQSLVADLDCETQASRACVVYLNGEYWGVYALQEEYSDDYFEETHGIDNGDVVLYKGQDYNANNNGLGYKLDEGSLPAGESDESYYFRELFDLYGKYEDCSSAKAYEEFCKLVDVESLRDYFAVQIWINNKWDWPGKNWSVWKSTRIDETNPYSDGRWRFCFYDLDFGGWMGASEAHTNTIQEDNYATYGLLDLGTQNLIAKMYAYAMTNQGFRDDFANSLESLSENQYNKDTATAALDVYKGTWEPILGQFFERFPGVTTAQDALERNDAANYPAIKAFLAERASAIPSILNWVRDHYNDGSVLSAEDFLKVTGSWAKKGNNHVNVLTADGFQATVIDIGWWLQISDLNLSGLKKPALEVIYEANDDTLQVSAGTGGEDSGWDLPLTDGVENSGCYKIALDKAYTTLYITGNNSSLHVTQIRIYDASKTGENLPGADIDTKPSPTPGNNPTTPKPSPTPGGNNPTNPGTSAAPGGNNPTNPGTSTAPGGNNPTNPGTSTAPGGDNPANPGASTAPGGDNPTNPGTSASPAPGTTKDKDSGDEDDDDDASKTVKIKKVTLKKVTGSKKTIVVQWSKVSGVTGYEVQIATKKNFKKDLTKYTVKKAGTVKKTIKKLQSNQKYFVRVRAYKTVSGKKYTGSWSKVKNVKVK